jgi:succinyl-CoA synthetase beta subunit
MEAIKLLENDERITSIIFTIFGSMTDCDIIARCILNAMEDIKTSKPIILLLKGRNSESAKRMIDGVSEKLGITFCEDMDSAAKLAVKLAKEIEE